MHIQTRLCAFFNAINMICVCAARADVTRGVTSARVRFQREPNQLSRFVRTRERNQHAARAEDDGVGHTHGARK